MSIIDEVLNANTGYAQEFDLGLLPGRPARKLAVLSCMDCRLTVEQILGLRPGDAHILRNAGGTVTEDVLRSLLISHHMLGVEEIMIINHTECGMMTFQDDDLRRKLQALTGTAAITPSSFWTFRNLEDNVREQVQKLQAHPWIPDALPIRGFVYDVRTGKLTEVAPKPEARPS
jgi:carbonic anhydrase